MSVWRIAQSRTKNCVHISSHPIGMTVRRGVPEVHVLHCNAAEHKRIIEIVTATNWPECVLEIWPCVMASSERMLVSKKPQSRVEDSR